MSVLYEIEGKLQMADYLLNRSEPFPDAAIKHIVEAANDLIVIYLDLGRSSINPILATKKLEAVEETYSFAIQYKDFWKLPLKDSITREEAINAYKATKAFLGIVKRAYGSA